MIKHLLKILLITLTCKGFCMQSAPYGSWVSPVTLDSLVKKGVGLSDICVDKDIIYWSELRPDEKGRGAIVKYENKNIKDVIGKSYNARSLVHEYGGKSYTAVNGCIYFINFKDQNIYKVENDKQPVCLTKGNGRYIDLVISEKNSKLFAVKERKEKDETINEIIVLDLLTKEEKIVAFGHDFFSSIAISPDEKKLAYVYWDHPNMPWDNTFLIEVDIDDSGSVLNDRQIAGEKNESICEVEYSLDGSLYFVSDRNGFWNIYRRGNSSLENICLMDAEFAFPHWVFGMRFYSFVKDGDSYYIVAAFEENGIYKLIKINPFTKDYTIIPTEYTQIEYLSCCSDQKIVFIGSSFDKFDEVVILDLKNNKKEIIKKSKDFSLDKEYISTPEQIKFLSSDGEYSYAYYYPPKNKDYKGLKDELPLLIVQSHGGPTSNASTALNLKVQFWTSRGFGFLDVDYAGSSGYGRAYRKRLNDKWGIIDIDDCVLATKYLCDKKMVDKDRLIIRGGSAGGYTTMAALTFRDVFKAGASYYGVSDLEALAKDTHKFEMRYLDGLVGKYPDKKDIYFQRSPINFTKDLSCPIIFLQGEDDKIVPPDQSKKMYDILVKKGIPTEYLLFEKEAHGFRKAENIKKSLQSELCFYSKIFHFPFIDK